MHVHHVQAHCTSLRSWALAHHTARGRHQRMMHAQYHPCCTAVPNRAVHIATAPLQQRQWLFLDEPLLWQGTYHETIQNSATPFDLAPSWKMLLLSDGSVTRHLQLLTGEDVMVDCVEMEQVGGPTEADPPAISLLQGPLLRRQVWLYTPSRPQHPLVYATSWWNAEEANSYLVDKAKPIWVSLASERIELYREIQTCYYGHHEALAARFGCSGPFAGRQYVFWHEGRPLTVIHEVFSPSLSQFIGPMVGDATD